MARTKLDRIITRKEYIEHELNRLEAIVHGHYKRGSENSTRCIKREAELNGMIGCLKMMGYYVIKTINEDGPDRYEIFE